MSNALNILFVDDDFCRPERLNTLFAEYSKLQNYDPAYNFYFETAEESTGTYNIIPVIKKIETIQNLNAVILDIMFGDNGNRLGIQILSAIREKYPTLPIFMMTSIENNVDVLEKCMELGANEYFIKLPTLSEFEKTLKVYTQPNSLESDFALWGNSKPIRNVRALIARIAASAISSVLITGDSGTGKELVARAIHRQGSRKYGPFIDKNCAHEKSELLDDDLFGHEKGAFTGADRQYIGRFERANKGLLFLDEIGSMPHELQGKLLRVLETKRFQRIGGTESILSDFQLICATNEDPQKLIKEGKLREDLYYRIKQIEINVPPLRERIDDISILAEIFLRKFISSSGGSYPALTISEGCKKALISYNWPGNIRELKNVIERAVILSKEKTIDINYLPPEISNPNKITHQLKNEITAELYLDENRDKWPQQRIIAELILDLKVKEKVKSYKGNQWKAEFMRLMYPENKAPSAKGFNDLIRRLTNGPWGEPNLNNDPELKKLLEQLLK